MHLGKSFSCILVSGGWGLESMLRCVLPRLRCGNGIHCVCVGIGAATPRLQHKWIFYDDVIGLYMLINYNANGFSMMMWLGLVCWDTRGRESGNQEVREAGRQGDSQAAQARSQAAQAGSQAALAT